VNRPTLNQNQKPLLNYSMDKLRRMKLMIIRKFLERKMLTLHFTIQHLILNLLIFSVLLKIQLKMTNQSEEEMMVRIIENITKERKRNIMMVVPRNIMKHGQKVVLNPKLPKNHKIAMLQKKQERRIQRETIVIMEVNHIKEEDKEDNNISLHQNLLQLQKSTMISCSLPFNDRDNLISKYCTILPRINARMR